MTTEFLHRHRAGCFLVIFLSISTLFMALRLEPAIQGIKSALWFLVSPNVVYSGEFLNRFDGLRGRFFHLVVAEAENHILRDQLAQVSQRDLQREALEKENIRLRGVLDLRQKRFGDAVAAEVVGVDVRDWFHALIINKGRRDGLAPSAAVVGGSPDHLGLVGRVAEVSEHSAKVMLITDLISSVSASIKDKGDMGLLEGRNRPWCVLRYLSQDTSVTSGDEVVTAGLGGIFPPGISIGQVMDLTESDEGFFKTARIKPAVNFGSLHEVLVVHRKDAIPAEKAAP